MSYQFRPGGLIVVNCRVATGTVAAVGRFALDTGASRTMLAARRADILGLTMMPGGRVITASRVETARLAMVPEISALGITRRDLEVIVMPLPASSGLDGLLGLDFLRDTRVTIDFRAGILSIG